MAALDQDVVRATLRIEQTDPGRVEGDRPVQQAEQLMRTVGERSGGRRYPEGLERDIPGSGRAMASRPPRKGACPEPRPHTAI